MDGARRVTAVTHRIHLVGDFQGPGADTLQVAVILELGAQRGVSGRLAGEQGSPCARAICPALTAAWSTTITSSTNHCSATARLP